MSSTPIDNFRACLGNRTARDAIGIELTDDQARLLLSDDELVAVYYQRWREARLGRAAPGSPAPQSPRSMSHPPPVHGQTQRPATQPVVSAKKPGFPFRRPIVTDWVFWWAALIGVLTVLAMLANYVSAGYSVTSSRGAYGLLLDILLSVPLNFAVFVLPVAALMRWIRVRRAQNSR